MIKKEAGQSIIEVIFATMVVSLVLVAVLATIIASLRNSRTSLEQTEASQLASQTVEWWRQSRAVQGWATLAALVPNTNDQQVYCFTALPSGWENLSSFSGSCDPADKISDTIYRREVTLVRSAANELEVQVSVAWPGKTGEMTTELETIFGRWD